MNASQPAQPNAPLVVQANFGQPQSFGMVPAHQTCFFFPRRALGFGLALAFAPFATAVDLDIVLSEKERAAHVTPHCVRLFKSSAGLSADEKFNKALCLKFGIDAPPGEALAVGLLRELAVQGHGQAQLALADTLQQGSGAEHSEALRWYERSAAAGDSRAMPSLV
jgi:TPR repeat protein